MQKQFLNTQKDIKNYWSYIYKKALNNKFIKPIKIYKSNGQILVEPLDKYKKYDVYYVHYASPRVQSLFSSPFTPEIFTQETEGYNSCLSNPPIELPVIRIGLSYIIASIRFDSYGPYLFLIVQFYEKENK